MNAKQAPQVCLSATLPVNAIAQRFLLREMRRLTGAATLPLDSSAQAALLALRDEVVAELYTAIG